MFFTSAMQDLEDLDAGSFEGVRQPVGKGQVLRHLLRNTDDPQPQTDRSGADLPEKYGIWVKTFGCAHNMSDSEYMIGQLQDYGYRQASMLCLWSTSASIAVIRSRQYQPLRSIQYVVGSSFKFCYS